jgi:flavin reductase (DIM6/NTAB) family NADH-FMN oxidoreductase RutF
MPTVIVGSLVDGNPNFVTISYVGIVQHNPPMASVTLINSHYTNHGIKENKTFSINIPDSRLLKKTDFLGMNSGSTIDKASLFDVFYGELKSAPMIMETPLNLECKLVDVIDLKNNNEIFIGEIVESYSSKKYLRRGIPDLRRLDPILFSINSNSYHKIGRRIGKAWQEGLHINSAKLRKQKSDD